MDVSGFYKLSVDERLKRIKEAAGLTDEEAELLKKGGALSIGIADRMIENVVGAMHLPFAIATNFKINGKEMLIPMAIEEPSVVAGACKAAKLCLPEGFGAEGDESVMMGEVQLVNLADAAKAKKQLEAKKSEIVKIAAAAYRGNQEFWGGIKEFEVRKIKTKRGVMLICDFYIDVKDVMGANTINSILEFVSPTLEAYSGGKARLRILSNLAVRRKVRAGAVWKKEVLGEDAVEAVLDGYEFAANDIFRCATHNKGIMNGVDAVALACGQDWRAVEAGAHAYASIGGYHPLTKFEKNKNGDLAGSIELPLAVGLFGGAINTSPTAKIALRILGAKTAKELAMAMACAGLANNFAALYALATTGIQAGHMKLHARNIAVLAGAKTPEEIDAVADEMAGKKDYSAEFAKSILGRMRR
ncbi:hydroxymethylglutaryl-CoA reductase, degradative [Candidatus Micrarchaeota archaeon]|nr:hydroxymethylglutaryl-CoA reductase, degradative [Candidatus Micrarchaeota archaeon]